MRKLKLHGFNNLTKTLSFNIYDICYAESPSHRHEYIEYIDDAYNAERLTVISKGKVISRRQRNDAALTLPGRPGSVRRRLDAR